MHHPGPYPVMHGLVYATYITHATQGRYTLNTRIRISLVFSTIFFFFFLGLANKQSSIPIIRNLTSHIFILLHLQHDFPTRSPPTSAVLSIHSAPALKFQVIHFLQAVHSANDAVVFVAQQSFFFYWCSPSLNLIAFFFFFRLPSFGITAFRASQNHTFIPARH
jgi:hypothetical protein